MSEKIVEVTLDAIQLSDTKPRSLAKTDSIADWEDEYVDTALGALRVSVQGDRSKPAIITYHDIGLNATTCFQGFFNYPDMRVILRHFCVYHITAPGQTEGAMPLPQGGMKHSESETLSSLKTQLIQNDDGRKRTSLGFTELPLNKNGYVYPTMEQLSEMITPVLEFFNLKQFIGFGVGAGANILARYAVDHPEKMDSLVLINCASGRASWVEWGYQKFNTWYLRGGSMSSGVEEYLLWHWFGRKTVRENHDLICAYQDYVKTINPQNLGHFIESYINRSDLCIWREMDPLKQREARTIRCPLLLVTSDWSPHVEDVVTMNTRIDPATCQLVKYECGGMIHEEIPGKLTESFRLFLQGQGYVPSLSQTRLLEEARRLEKAHSSPTAAAAGKKTPPTSPKHKAAVSAAPHGDSALEPLVQNETSTVC